MKKVVFLGLIMFFATFFVGGCDFLTPKDDLNGNNKEEVEKIVDVLDIEKKIEANSKAMNNSQLNQKTSQQSPPQKTLPPSDSKLESERDPQIEQKNLEYSNKYEKARIVTNYGEIRIRFFSEDAPLAVGNFLRLAEEGFYDNTKFHRVIDGFMIQGGDPNSKDDDWSDDGKGGPEYTFSDEINDHKLVKGSLAMANSGPDTNGSQFFIVTAKETPHLDGKHTNFGEVYKGMDVVEKIEKVRIDENDHPTQDVIIKEIKLKLKEQEEIKEKKRIDE